MLKLFTKSISPITNAKVKIYHKSHIAKVNANAWSGPRQQMSTLSNFFHSSRLRRRWRRQVPECKTLPQFSHQHRFSFPPRQFPRHFFRLHTFLVWLDFPCRSCALFGFTRFPTTLAFTSLQASIPCPQDDSANCGRCRFNIFVHIWYLKVFDDRMCGKMEKICT